MKKYDVVIIGAGTAGLTARKEVAKKTSNYLVVEGGPIGTTCARIGCMPSKVLIQAANDFHRRHSLEIQGISGGMTMTADIDETMKHVRSLRDRFVRGVTGSMPEWEDKLVRARAKFIDVNTLELDGEKVQADKIIIATGSRPIIPGAWSEFNDFIITTDDFFELDEMPKDVIVIGMGVIGLEIGQALKRLGVNVIAAGLGKEIGGITEPELQDYIISKFSEEMPIHTEGAELLRIEGNKLIVKVNGNEFKVDKAIVAVGRKPNVDNMGMENLNIELTRGIPKFSRTTFALEEQQHIFLVGDVTGERPLLHEAADEGFIAGHNAVSDFHCFKRRPNLGITFSDPNIATIGKRYSQLKSENVDFITGTVSFEGQGRSIVKLKEVGMLKIFAAKEGGEILGCELFAPDGEHLAHLIAWGMSMKLTVNEMLKMPFYHPVVEEGLKTALRNAKKELTDSDEAELARCQETLIR